MTPNAAPLRTVRLILAALALGVLLFTGVVAWMRTQATEPANADVGRLLVLIAVGLAVMELPVYLVLRGSLVGRARERKSGSLEEVKADRVPPPLQTLAIVGAALAEGVGLLGVIALLLGGPWYALAIPVLAVVLILAQLPTRGGMERTLRGG